MTGKCNLVLIYNADNHSERWLTREDFIIGKNHYKFLMSFHKSLRHTLPPSKINDILTLFSEKTNDRYLGILKSDRMTKLEIEDYRTLSRLLEKSKYRFNKKTQKLVKIK
jgi:hypothetical protein